MIINQKLCIGCGKCLPICPARAIAITNGKARIDKEQCFECGVCYRLEICPVSAFEREQEIEWPRSLKAILSDPLTEYVATGVTGRGTEEMKTNDVTNRISHGEIGVCVDVGRPNVGTRLREVEKLVLALAPVLKSRGLWFERDNPVSSFIEDEETGKFKPEIIDIRVMSAIIEFKIPLDMLSEIVDLLANASRDIDTVFSLGIIEKVSEDGKLSSKKILEGRGYKVAKRGKVNIGLAANA